MVAWRCLPSRHARLLLTIARHTTHTPVEPHSGQTGTNVEFWEESGRAAYEEASQKQLFGSWKLPLPILSLPFLRGKWWNPGCFTHGI